MRTVALLLRAIPCLAVLFGAMAVVQTAAADCQINTPQVTCTGDVTSGVFSLPNYILKVENLTSDIDNGLWIVTRGQNGGSGQPGFTPPVTVIQYDGGSNAITFDDTGAAVRGLQATSAGGLGGNGNDRGKSSDLHDVTGDSGGYGGSGDLAEVTVTSGSVNTTSVGGNAVAAFSEGNTGGSGGEGRSGLGSARGGDGGRGGMGGQATAIVNTAYPDVATTDIIFTQVGSVCCLPAVIVQSQGSNGGAGGFGHTDGGNAHGGQGGDGGAAYQAKVEIGPGSITPSGAASGVQAIARGGDGGRGGDATSDASSESNAGNGGSGGDGGSVIANIGASGKPESIVMRPTIAGVWGISLSSIAGNGGDGGNAKSNVVGNAHGGDGGQGGAGGSVDATIYAAVTIKPGGSEMNGLFIQSYGGSGGNGGDGEALAGKGHGGAAAGSGPGGDVTLNFSGSVFVNGTETNAALVQSVGGFSGSGGSGSGFEAYGAGSESAGAGGNVSVTLGNNQYNTGSEFVVGEETKSDNSVALQVQSIGGGGGRGSSGDGIDALGGSGSAGGDGGKVTVTIPADVGGNIDTVGDNSDAFVVQSIGGGGGDAGAVGGVRALGGSGGSGGDGGQVQIVALANISSRGTASTGMLAASIGGGGGSAHSTSGVHSVGGSGGSGGDGGDVTFTWLLNGSAAVFTQGADSDGIVMQSIGGGGGHGSSALAISSNFGQAVGGSGGDGGSGGEVSFKANGQENSEPPSEIETGGDRSRGVVLQSIGGGGGHGGNAISVTVPSVSASVSLGASGSGGAAGNGSTVLYDVTGVAVETAGSFSAAISAQSIGGGGGSAGTGIALTTVDNIDVSYAVGGSGGGGGAGGTVTVSATGQRLSTTGGQSPAILAQSIGGGGGNGGTTVSGNGGSVSSASISVGGRGGNGGNGAAVGVSVSGSSVHTQGDQSYGLQAQSIGGGGGHGGTTLSLEGVTGASGQVALGGAGGNGGDGGAVKVDLGASLSTTGSKATAILAQSIGGGGGSSGLTGAFSAGGAGADVAVGGDGGGGGSGSAVTVTASGGIKTEGDIAAGIRAQSIGGGGGHSGITLGAAAATNPAAEVNVQVGQGGNAGAGGDGGEVTVAAGSIATKGDSASGISAMSVGGGGGDSHFTGAFDAASGVAFNATVGGRGGDGGDGGKVTVNQDGSIATAGNNAQAIKAMSVGGGGGDSGITVSGSGFSLPGDTAVGGDGGNSGSGGAVSVTAEPGTIATQGKHSDGIYASSVARGGGHSGYVGAGAGVAGGVANMSVGGKGGSAGSGGAVTVVNLADIETAGGFANAIFAQSVGGSGGSAKGSLTGSALSIGSLQLSVGGAGAAGGTGGAVDVALDGVSLKTGSHNSAAVLAQSVGGAGGNGGLAAEGSFTAGKVSGQASLSIGGSGGDGGQSSEVSVTLSDANSIETSGFGSTGILAQSVGGSGGNGGNVYSGNVTLSQTASANVNVDVGGSGGKGGKAAAVLITGVSGNTLTQQITTDGYRADGILAQSIGGAGGSGGSVYTVLATVARGSSARVGVAVGGKGGSGQDAGTVTLDFSKLDLDITTAKGGSNGISAMSVGGGGGRGGAAASINVEPLPSASADSGGTSSLDAELAISVGGSGGSAGNGDAVSVTTSGGSILTKGESAKGIYATSVGGGGGDGGTASAVSFSFDGICKSVGIGTSYICNAVSGGGGDSGSTLTVSSDVVVGGSGGASGDGGAVTVDYSGTIETEGHLSHGVVAHSIGGGGGEGGEGALGINAWTTDEIAQGIANLPGNFTFIPNFTTVDMAVGGSGGAAGSGGDVTVTFGASSGITTSGKQAFGIHAQSIGGGGGNGGAGTSGVWAAASVGGLGSGGGDGGGVSVTFPAASQIKTSGEGSVAIFAQSVGGGGGTAGDVEKGFSDSWLDLNIGVGVGVQTDAGAGGDGGAVTVALSGTPGSAPTIVTTGTNAHGIVAQSVGGSGGVLGISGIAGGNLPNDFAGSAGDSGDGGDVTVTVDGGISVAGESAHAIFAQSVGGSSSDDTAGNVTIDINADVTASGSDGRAILAQSQGGGGNGTIAISVADGVTVESGVASYETIGYFDGAANRLTNAGTIRNPGTTDESFVVRTNGMAPLAIANKGAMAGSLSSRLKNADPGQAITVVNAGGATFGLGQLVHLGTGGSFDNQGSISAGTLGTVGSSTMTGDFTQASGATLQVDFAFDGGNDLITVRSGAQPVLAGSVLPNPLDSLPSNEQAGELTIFTAVPGIASNSLTVANTATITYGLRQEARSAAGDVVLLDYEVDYSPWSGSAAAEAKVSDAASEKIGPNHDAVAGYIDTLVTARQEAVAAGSDELAFVDDLVGSLLATEEVADLIATYDDLAPGEIFAATDAAQLASLRFADNLNSCPNRMEGGQVSFTRQGSCVWLQVQGGGVDRQRDSRSVGYDESYVGVSLGGQGALGEDFLGGGFFLGGAFGYENSNLSNSGFSGDGNRFQGGIAVKKEIAATTLSASLSGGVGAYDQSRQVQTPGGTLVASSSPNANWIAVHARVTQVIDLDEQLYLKPRFDLGVDQQWQGAYEESGAGDYGLRVEGFSQTAVTLNPVLEVGGGFEVLGVQTNAVASAGLLAVVAGRERTTEVNLLGASSLPGYQVSDLGQAIYADVGAGLEFVVHERAVVSLGGQALVAGNQQAYGGTGRVSIFF